MSGSRVLLLEFVEAGGAGEVLGVSGLNLPLGRLRVHDLQTL